MIVEPQVKLIAHTIIDHDAISELMEIQPESTDAETLVTFADRTCSSLKLKTRASGSG